MDAYDRELKREIATNKAVYHAQIAVFGTFMRNLMKVGDSSSVAVMKHSILSRKPKNPMNGYNLFIHELVSANKHLSVKQVSERYSSVWNDKAYKEKTVYKKHAASLYYGSISSNP